MDGLGVILYYLKNSGKLVVVVYVFRIFMLVEKNYYLGKLEFLVLKWIIFERFWDYLFYVLNFIIGSDNNLL